ncbi:MAG: magnesium/cobalt transporter CorA [Planctomycetes bacterium]|nr:magnesium/cobalt transporter CorA [Planctomycetota bacterium]
MGRSSEGRHRPAAAQRPRWWRRRRRPAPGSSPGTVVPDPAAKRPLLRVMAYGPDTLAEATLADVDEVDAYLGRHPVTWLNVDGLGDQDVIARLASRFGLHRLAVEDVTHTGQRAKVEEYPENAFLVLAMVNPGPALELEQLSLFLGDGFVVTFQESRGDCFDPVRKRLREGKGRIRVSGPDYLAYALIDLVIDSYFPEIERQGERLDHLENRILDGRPDRRVVADIHEVKRDLLALRRIAWPARDMLSALLRGESPRVAADTKIYLRDVHDHAVQVIDLLETYRELGASLMESYLSSVSNRMNEVVKVLTIISTIFMPLTFIAGVYGMNFDPDASPWNMPELRWWLGYPLVLALMAVVAGCMVLWFWRRGWLRR